MKIIIATVLAMFAFESTTTTVEAQRLGGLFNRRDGRGRGGGRGGGPLGLNGEDVDFIDLGCAGENLVQCPVRRRHRNKFRPSSSSEEEGESEEGESEEEEAAEGIYVCRDLPKPKSSVPRRWAMDSDEGDSVEDLSSEEVVETVEASVCVSSDRAVIEDECGCCGASCEPCTCGCDYELKNGTMVEGVYVMIDSEGDGGEEECVPSHKAVTMVELFEGVSCKPEPCV